LEELRQGRSPADELSARVCFKWALVLGGRPALSGPDGGVPGP
jgi:hypothetical protein